MSSKDFDNWNEQKKILDSRAKNKFYHERDVWWCRLGLNVGHEQNGSGDQVARPVLILKGFSRELCLIIPITKSKKKHRYLIPIGKIENKSAQLIISQIKTIDTRRLTTKITRMVGKEFDVIKKATKDLI